MKKSKISISFTKYSDANLKNKAESILQCMTGNPAFSSPIPTLADLQAAILAYGIALVNAADLGRSNVAVKNQCRATLESLLNQLGMYVMFIANGDLAILTSSGYSVNKTPEPQPLTAPATITVKNGITSGQLIVNAATVNVPGYLHEITPDPLTSNSIWSANPSRASKFTFTNLQPAQKYWMRTAAVGKGGQLAFSPTIWQIAQ